MSDHPYTELTPDLMLDAIETQGYQCSGHYLTLNSYENRVFQIGIEDGAPLIAKFYRPERWTTEQILEEHQFCHELSTAEWPVVAPHSNAQGNSLFEYAGFQFALYERKGGRAPDLDNLDNLEVLGRCLGRLHAIGSQRPFAHRPQVDLQSYAIDSREFLLAHDLIPASLVTAYDTLTRDLIDRLSPILQNNPYQTIRLHADCHPGNILWRDSDNGGIPNFVDFDDCRSGPAIQDLWMLLNGEREEQQMQLETLIDSYEQFHAFDARELALIEPLRTLRLMHYAAWLGRRWHDPAFKIAFPWFNTERYWSEHILELREQMAALQEPPLRLMSGF